MIFILLSLFCLNQAYFSALKTSNIARVKDAKIVKNIELEIVKSNHLTVLGTYAADFNAIEYAQRLIHYWPELKSSGIKTGTFVLNADIEASLAFESLLPSFPKEITILSDPSGSIGKEFKCNRGWLPDSKISPYFKLFIMFFGVGGKETLPSVIKGYIGNPDTSVKQSWIEESLRVGTLAGRYPDTALELDAAGSVIKNKFDDLPIVGNWGQRPLELATLRLQNMLGISLENWERLRPSDDNLDVLTQLGGVFVTDKSKKIQYEWRDDGICHTCDFAKLAKELKQK